MSDTGTDHILNNEQTFAGTPFPQRWPATPQPSHRNLANTANHKVFISLNKYLVKEENGNNQILVVAEGEGAEKT